MAENIEKTENKQFKEKKSYKLLYTILIEYAATLLLAFLMVLYQGDASPLLLRVINGMQVAGALLFVVGWFVFINHHGVFDVITYGVKAFFLSFSNRKMEKSLLDVRLGKKKMPKYLFLSMWINGIIVIGIAYSIYYIYYI